ncbi:MAG: hypothetical protein K2M17_05130 [Bacilli bacterium]|nr:hypothetical protein [Bacilli bacterium]
MKDIIITVDSYIEFKYEMLAETFVIESTNKLDIDDKSHCYIVADNKIKAKVSILEIRQEDNKWIIILNNVYNELYPQITFNNFKGIQYIDYIRYGLYRLLNNKEDLNHID